MTNSIKTLQSLATSGQLTYTHHGVYRPHDGATEWADNPNTGYRWDGVVDAHPCPDGCTHLDIGLELHDSDTTETVTAEDLGVDDLAYYEAIVESLTAGDTGHVTVRGRTVYAA